MRVGISTVETRPRRPCWSGCWRARQMAGRRPRRRGHRPPSPTSCPPSGSTRFTRRGARPRHQGDDAAPDGRARHRDARAARRRPPSTRCSAIDPDGVFFSNGPGDPATADRAGRAAARGARPPDPALRHLLRQPAPRPGAGFGTYKLRLRPPRHQPAGASTGPPARSRSPRTTTASRSTRRSTGPTRDAVRRGREVSHVCLNDDVVEGLRCLDVAGVLGAVPPGGRGRPARRGATSSTASELEALAWPRRGAAAVGRSADATSAGADYASEQRPGDRLRPDRHRPGLRVRLLRHPGLPGAARRRACGSSWSTPTRRRS